MFSCSESHCDEMVANESSVEKPPADRSALKKLALPRIRFISIRLLYHRNTNSIYTEMLRKMWKKRDIDRK